MQDRRLPAHLRNLCLVAMLTAVMAGPFSFSGSHDSAGILAASPDTRLSRDATILAQRLHQISSDDLMMDDLALQELGREIDLVLTQIRNRHPRMAEISARQWHRPSVLLLELEGDLLDAVVERWTNGNVVPLPRTGHMAFDELNARIGLHGAEVLPSLSIAIMHVSNLANLRVARGAYAAVEGIRHASFDEILGDGPDIVAANPDGSWYVAMRDAWGDCPSGCIHSEAFFFIVERGHLEQVTTRDAENIPQFRAIIPTLERTRWFPETTRDEG